MRALLASLLLLMVVPGVTRGERKGDYLSEEETDKIREAQDPSERIGVYVECAQTRLERIDDYRQRPADPMLDTASYLDQQFDQYIRITDELKNWIQVQYDRHADMRAGLKKFIEIGPKQVEQLRHIQQSPDPYVDAYRKNLGDAIDDFDDALDGASKAFSDQVKMFGELKREEKADARTAQEREKEEKKRAKEEKKLRKKEHQQGVPADADEN